MDDDYSLAVAPGVCDYADFAAFARSGAVTGKNAAEAARMLALCRGPYLEKETYEWAVESAREIEAEYERIALELAGYHAAGGRVPEAENVLSALLARNPLSAEGCEALLDLCMGGGDRAAYCQRYEQYARLMKKEFRLKPQARYREHYERVKRAK
jgi:two-component SAPR family response regulator